ncbi:peptidyl-prolyl cis-trans isomerase [Aestuariicella hydrocarbonica]|uniref:Peptidyl-prolyl cis-trans isomerase n=1 Tax=Pseudomaricurvus hydrocarbonicus TaxID=1470433 RepID=A0A9E5MNX8_9GAMM|nr:peptidylprolyl isomerase [Aestuariicella hydrocarbonica]NHO67768.1 peptidyl-prolyl cis-trans isomerase [Aestuariicella hydrocarbonica]
MNILKEPLLHFLLIGAVFFVGYGYLNPDSLADGERIVVQEGRINSLIAQFRRTWNRAPSDEELQKLVDDFVLEEIYYRQAVALGIDKDDTLIRRRLRQKMEFLSVSMASDMQPEEQELQAYFVAHAHKYRSSSRYSFEQIYINPDRSSEALQQRISEVRQALSNRQPVSSDASMLASQFEQAPDFQVNNLFGRGFSEQLDGLLLNQWSEPYRSGMGMHFIKVTERIEGEVPALQDVRAEVLRDWSYDTTNEIKSKIRQGLLAEYKVVIEWPPGAES